jgi:hypothetical protein
MLKTETGVIHSLEEDVKPNLPKKGKIVKPLITRVHPAPPNWKQTYDMICEMRSRVQAPVDTMGCDQEQVQESDPKVWLCRGFDINTARIELEFRTKDFLLSSRLCFLPKPRMKMLMPPLNN